ncbi:hypothetical protein OROMI_016352 [Orobanche minor]
MSPLTEKKKQKKVDKPKAKGTVIDPVTVDDLPSMQPADHQTQGATPAVDSSISRPSDPQPTTTMTDHHIFDGLENLDESDAHIESIVSSPVRVAIPEPDPTLNRVPSPSRDPTPNRVLTPVKDSSPIQAPIPVEDPVHTENSIHELFILDVTGINDIHLLIQWENQQCQELIFSHYLAQNHSRLNEQNQSEDAIPPVQQDNFLVPTAIPAAFEETSCAIPQEEPVPLQEQAIAERQHEEETTPVPLSTESHEVPHVAAPSSADAPSSSKRLDSPRTEAKKEQLDSLGRQTVFIQEAVDALYQVGKEMDWLNLTASEEMLSVKTKLTKIAEVFRTLPQDLKEAFTNFQQLEEQSLLEEQSNSISVKSKWLLSYNIRILVYQIMITKFMTCPYLSTPWMRNSQNLKSSRTMF